MKALLIPGILWASKQARRPFSRSGGRTKLRAWAPLVLAFTLGCANAEPWRPQFHFTPEKNWLNDPNGMYFQDGEWHLFYQYNPFGDKWGHMSWGHAVSTDLLHWKHLPLALAEEEGKMVFSGSAVVDAKNTSGFGKDGHGPVVAIYTAHTETNQAQAVAYSNDAGRTWTKYAGNPVLDLGEKDFRDPKVRWHEGTQQWIMTVAWPQHHQVRFYSSPDLKKWTHLSDFGPAGSVVGIWECPDLFPLPNPGGGTKWVLIINVGQGGPAGGSGTQYFLGNFDGTKFTNDGPEAPRWVDHGPDFYAGVTWSGHPAGDDRTILLGWMSNWQYANEAPTNPWRSGMSLPRELTLSGSKDTLALAQTPVREMAALGSPTVEFKGGSVAAANEFLAKSAVPGDALDLTLMLSGAARIEVLADDSHATRISIDPAKGQFSLDRTKSGKIDFHEKFPLIATAPLTASAEGRVTLRIVIDAGSVEVFASEGRTVLSSLIFAPPTARAVRIADAEGVHQIRVRTLAK